MGIVLIVLLNASVFSVGGIGEDRSIFRMPFADVSQTARIEFTLRPEFNILNKGSDLRGIFWTHPFYFNLTVPVTKGFIFGLGNLERFNQSFDVYFEEGELEMHANGEGGIEEIYAQLSNNFGIGEMSLRGSYLFGNASEVWDYYIGAYSLADSFLYNYHGKILGAGIKIKFVELSYEGFGSVEMEKADSDTLIDLPDRLSIGFIPETFGGKLNILLEHSFWPEHDDYRSPTRFKIGFLKKRVGISYMFNPWYLKKITEHGLDFSLNIPIQRVGSITLNLGCFLKNKGSLREITLFPEIKLTIRELFARRRK